MKEEIITTIFILELKKVRLLCGIFNGKKIVDFLWAQAAQAQTQ
jgi:hypothetical protein